MSWSTMAVSMSWRMKAWCSASDILQNPVRIGTSDLLVISTRSRIFSDRAWASSCRMIRMSFISSHSSKASIIMTYDGYVSFPPRFKSGLSTSWRHWSARDWLAIMLSAVIASQMCCLTGGMCTASCIAIVVTNLLILPASPLPREKKKLAASRPCSN